MSLRATERSVAVWRLLRSLHSLAMTRFAATGIKRHHKWCPTAPRGGILLDAMIKLWYTFLRDNKIMIKSKNKGFTYIELVIALAIIAFIVLAFSQLFLHSVISVKSMEFQTLAYNFAGDKMEDIKNNEAFAGIGGPEWYPTVWRTDYPNQPGKNFTRKVTVSELVTGSLKRVDIEVTWMEGSESKSIGISSLIANK